MSHRIKAKQYSCLKLSKIQIHRAITENQETTDIGSAINLKMATDKVQANHRIKIKHKLSCEGHRVA